MTPAKYKSEREQRGTQESVAEQLGVNRETLARRETGTREISREAWIALLSLPAKKQQ